jgi:hypothetical protein
MAVELMICEALVQSNEHITLPGNGGALRRMSECPADFHAYWRLGDWILSLIGELVGV